MKKLLFVALVAALSMSTLVAFAAGPVTRDGVDYSGTRQTSAQHPCLIGADVQHPTHLDVKCNPASGAQGPAFIRYRFLADVDAQRNGATISASISTWIGDDCFAEWMVSTPKNPARTLRITVPAGSYCDIVNVEWSQP